MLYLRHGTTTPDALNMKVVLPSGESFDYRVPVVKAQDYTGDEIFAKRLLVLLPFYIMRYEKRLPEIAASERQSAALVAECAHMRECLERITVDRDRSELYDHIVELAIRVSDYLLSSQSQLRKKVRAAMGGEILELMSDRIAAAEKEAATRGFEEGQERGFAQGLEQGLDQMAALLRESNVDDRIIAEAISKARANLGKY